MQQTFSPFETHPWCSEREMEDYIGTESCVDFGQQADDAHAVVVPINVGRKCSSTTTTTTSDSSNRRRLAAARKEEKKEFPPPISSPWVLKRYYTGDGRLIIKQENVGRHEYFEVRRANGRLTLQLVPREEEREEGCYGDVEERERDDCCDDGGCCCSNLGGEEGCDHDEPDRGGEDDDAVVDGCDESDGDPTVERAVRVEEREMTVAVGGGASGKCYNNNNYYTGVISRPCLLGMPVVPAIRTVHS